MKAELDDYLCESFPLLYADRSASMQETCMCWGFNVDDGWFDIIYRLSDKLEHLISEQKRLFPDKEPSSLPRAMQVKEKFGGLRFYLSNSTDEMEQAIREAEKEASFTCEVCGVLASLRARGERYHWFKTVCAGCGEPDGYKEFKEEGLE